MAPRLKKVEHPVCLARRWKHGLKRQGFRGLRGGKMSKTLGLVGAPRRNGGKGSKIMRFWLHGGKMSKTLGPWGAPQWEKV